MLPRSGSPIRRTTKATTRTTPEGIYGLPAGGWLRRVQSALRRKPDSGGCLLGASPAQIYDLHRAHASPVAAEALARIGQLYEIKRKIWGRGACPMNGSKCGNRRARPLLDSMHGWLQQSVRKLSGNRPWRRQSSTRSGAGPRLYVTARTVASGSTTTLPNGHCELWQRGVHCARHFQVSENREV
jgi:hypothetical protein